MNKKKRFCAIVFLFLVALFMDTIFYLLKKIRRVVYFPGA